MTTIMVRRPDVGTLSVAAAVVLGLQAFRVFTSHIFWVVGETSDRVFLAAIVFGGVILWGLAGPLARFAGIGHGRRVSIMLLAGMAVAGQFSESPTADMWIGGVGTVAFGLVLALWVASVGRAAGQGLALAFMADVAIRGVFRTVDAPFSDSPWAAGIVALLALLAVGGGWRAARRTAEFGGPLRSISLLGLGSALFVFVAFSGNFGQTAAPSGLDLRAALIWVAGASAAGLAWSSASAKSSRVMSLVHVAAASLVMAAGAWLAGSAPSSTVSGLALVGLGLPVAVTALFPEDRKPRTSAWSVVNVTVGGVLLVALLFILYSFYAPPWVLPGAVGATVVLALGSSLSRHQLQGKRLIPFWAPLLFLPPFIVGLVSGAPSSDAPPVAAGSNLNVMTYNIRQGFGATGHFDLEAVAQEIEKRPTDIVGLQEVGRGWVISGAVDTMAWLSLRLDTPAYYGANLGDLWGNAVLTRLPVFGVANTHFNSEGRVPRGFQRIGIQTTGAPITILHTHLDHEDDGDTVRAAQVVRVLEDWGNTPRTILLGDLNAEPDSVAIRTLANAGFVDATPDGPLTWPATAPEERIDYIFVTPDLTVKEAETRETLASDHFPVWASLAGT
ncbi:MAG: endonuclease/exonuclease/phosphatase family protein [Chloroflexi bacterium]|nr:endonuclease/exonuclease/phosphatase family protein [Chloroflexota bacterium]